MSLVSFQVLFSLGFLEFHLNHYLFTFYQNNTHIYLLVYLDDIIMTNTHATHISSLIQNLRQEFFMKDLGELFLFISIQVIINS